VKRWLQAILAIVLVVILTACESSSLPNQTLVKKAIALQVAQTQKEISQHLKLGLPKVTIDRVKISDRAPLTIQGLQSYRVKGLYDYTLKLSTRQVSQKDNSFEVYLQRQAEGKTWRLVQKQAGVESQNWATQLLQ
jgi:hypothetical protein